MKRKDWLDQLPPPPAPGTGDGAYQGWKLVVAAHAEKAGVLWDSEEPELPERIRSFALWLGDAELERDDVVCRPAGQRREIYAEAARRYNALGKLRKWLESERSWVVCGAPDCVYGTSFLLAKLDSLLQEES